jgi:SAM-dependent methyltransferase
MMFFRLLNWVFYLPVHLYGRLRVIRIFLRAHLPLSARVLDVGSGPNPWFRSNILCERFLADGVERGGQSVQRKNRPFCNCDATALPFRDKSFDFVYCSHVAEHVDDIEKLFSEVQRVGKAGYIETPNYLFEQLVGTTTHLWALWVEGNVLHAERKWMAGAPARCYHASHRLVNSYPIIPFCTIFIPELRMMNFWWKNDFKFVIHPPPQPLDYTKASE